MEPGDQSASSGQLGSIDLENLISNYTKELKEFAETINIYESVSSTLVESKIDELSHLRFQEIENALRQLPKPPSFQLRAQIVTSIQKINEEFKAKIQAAQQQYESALITLKVRLTEAFLNMVSGIVGGKSEEKTTGTIQREAIKLILVNMEALDQRHHKLAQKMFEDDTAELLSSMTLVEEALMTYRKEMTNHFQSYRCMSCELFFNLHKHAEMTAKAKFDSDSSPFFVDLTNGLNRMQAIFAAMNELIIKSENNLVLEMNQREPRIVNFYKEMMKNEKQEDYKIPELKLKEIEVKENVKFVVEVKNLSIDNLKADATKVIYNQRRIYNCKMDECLKKAGGMTDPLQLKKLHDSYSTYAENTVVFELKKIEGLESQVNYVETLQRKIKSDWLQLKTENDKKLREKEEKEREVGGNKHLEEGVLKEKALQTESCQHPERYPSQFNGKVKPSFTSTPKTSNSVETSSTKMQAQILKPEILQEIAIEFGFHFIRVGRMNPKTHMFEILKNEWDEEATRSVVALTLDGEVLVGNEACNREHTGLKWSYSMHDLIYLSDMENKLSYGLGGFQDVRKELLMGHMLLKVKKGVEKMLNGVWETVVLTVPLWYTSVLRQATRDAATIAGFKHIHLVNETSAVAMSYAGCQPRSPYQREMILVGVCHDSYFDVGLYDVSLHVRQVRMESCCGDRHRSRRPHTPQKRMDLLLDVFLESISLSKDTIQVEQQSNGKFTEFICVNTDPGNNSWSNMIGLMHKEKFMETVRIGGDVLNIVEGAAAIASLVNSKETISQKQLLLQNIIQDKMVYMFLVKYYENNTRQKHEYIFRSRVPFTQEISLEGINYFNACITLQEDWENLGSVSYRSGVSGFGFRDVRLKLTINSEGILKVELFAGDKRMHESVDFTWSSLNMTVKEVQELADYVQSLEERSVRNQLRPSC